MDRLPVPCIVIDQDRRDAILDAPYRVSTDAASKERFCDEWDRLFTEIADNLAARWTRDETGEGDFFMVIEGSIDSLLCVEIANRDMLDESLLEVVHDAVANCEGCFTVDLCDAWGFMKTENGEDYPHFNIFVQRKRILIYSESDELLRKMGVTPQSDMEE